MTSQMFNQRPWRLETANDAGVCERCRSLPKVPLWPSGGKGEIHQPQYGMNLPRWRSESFVHYLECRFLFLFCVGFHNGEQLQDDGKLCLDDYYRQSGYKPPLALLAIPIAKHRREIVPATTLSPTTSRVIARHCRISRSYLKDPLTMQSRLLHLEIMDIWNQDSLILFNRPL